MSTQLTIAGAELERVIREGPAQRLAEAALAALARIEDTDAPKTAAAYAHWWRGWARFCDETGAQLSPIEAPFLVTYLESLTRGGSAPATVRQALCALSTLDRRARTTPTTPAPESIRRHMIVRDWLKNWGRENPRAPRRQAPSITPAQLRHVLTVAAAGPARKQARGAYVARYARDRALILLGVYGAFRVSELVGLELVHVRQADRGLEINVAKSKRDQQGQGRLVGVLPAGERAVCPLEALEQWLRVRGPDAGPLFTAIGRNGERAAAALTVRSAQRIVQALAKRAGVQLVTSHSMRATFVTLALQKGVSPEIVAAHAGMSSVQTVFRYARRATLFDRNPTAGLLDD